jgi:ATP-dependent helicase/nuclease subunit B
MHEGTFREVEAGATIITSSGRLARVLTHEFHRQQKEQGSSVWKTPDILPLDAFLKRIWREWVMRGTQPGCPALLSTLQEQMVWEQVIRRTPEGGTLLQIPETAKHAMAAWELIQAYRLKVDSEFEASDDWAAFAAWSRGFVSLCGTKNWLESARLGDMVARLFRDGETPRPKLLYIAGFDELTPQQSEFFTAAGDGRKLERLDFHVEPSRRKLRDSAAEIHAAAAWARQLLEEHPDAQIGVIVPDLERSRSKVERIFREKLDPAAKFDDRERSFHLSLGPSLAQYPAVNAALLMLEFGAGQITLPQAGVLLRSPFLGGAEKEWTKRALLDAKLRRNSVWDVNVAILRDAANSCPDLVRLLQRFEKQLTNLPAEQQASEWGGDFVQLLEEALKWPGDRPLSSREHQVVEAWYGALSNLAALDIATSPISFVDALDKLRRIAEATVFQVENEGAPIQIMGMLEASGLRFDHLWVMGLHQEAWPRPANPNPFLPIALQREHQLPHSSAERELEFASKVMERLLASAPDIVLSYPEAEGDRELDASPLAGSGWVSADAADQTDDWVARIRAAAQLEELPDEMAPPAVVDAMHGGGASLFKDMAACPFRAFAKHRLGARELEETDLGLNYKDRGTTVHKALEFIWNELGSQAHLIALTPDDLRDLIARAAEAAIHKLGSKVGLSVERRRLARVLLEWLEIEKSRSEFVVRKQEEEGLVTLGGLQIRTRADRVDESPDGLQIILDYKTGKVKLGGWDGERPDEPQLPLYCASSDQPVAGAAFVLIRVGELEFKGLADPRIAPPGLKKMSMETPRSFNEQKLEWRRVLEKLAKNYRAGHAEVDPKRDACDYCGLKALCRIRELENDRG